jgi:hypothetical protein
MPVADNFILTLDRLKLDKPYYFLIFKNIDIGKPVKQAAKREQSSCVQYFNPLSFSANFFLPIHSLILHPSFTRIHQDCL